MYSSLSGGVSPAHILGIDLPPASPDSGARESGSVCGTWRQTDSWDTWERIVLTNCALYFGRVRLRAEDVKSFYILPVSLRHEEPTGCLLVFHSEPLILPAGDPPLQLTHPDLTSALPASTIPQNK